MKVKKLIWRWVKRLLLIFAIVFFLASLLFGIAQTRWGKSRIERILEQTLGESTVSKVDIEGLHGFLPFSVAVDSAEFADTKGVWLKINDFSFRWSLLSLLKGVIHVESMRVGVLAIERVPTFPHKPKEPQPQSQQKEPSIRVDDFSIKRLKLGETIAGEDIVVSIMAKLDASVPGQGMVAEWDIVRTDGVPGTCRGRIAFVSDPAQLTMVVNLSDPQGSVAGRVAGREEPMPVLIDVRGSGLLSDWKAELRTVVMPLAELSAEVAVQVQESPIAFEQMTPAIAGELVLRLPTAVDERDTAAQSESFFIWRQKVDQQPPAMQSQFACEVHANTGTRTLTGDVSLEGDLALLSEFLPQQYRADAGQILTTLKIAGELDAPEASAHVVIQKLKFTNIPEPFEADISAVMDQEHISLTALRIQSTGTVLSGNIKLFRKESLSGVLAVQTDLAEVKTLLLPEGHDLRGVLNANVNIKGTLSEPYVTGTMTMVDGAYEHYTAGVVLNDLGLDLHMDEKRITLERFSARDNKDGSLVITGWFDLQPEDDYSFRLDTEFNKMTLVQSYVVTGTVDGVVSAFGTVQDIMIEGMLTPGPVVVNLPKQTGVRIPEIDVIEINVPQTHTVPVREKVQPVHDRRTRLNVAIESLDRVFVRGYGLESEWNGSLSIQGTVEEPLITGSLMVKRGTFDFLDRKFLIDEGILFFSGSVPPKPFIKLRAKTKVAAITAVVSLSGSLTEPEVAFNSEPELPQDEVVSYILFGKTVARLTPYQAVRLAQVVASLSGRGGGQSVLSRVQDIMHVDRLELEEGDGEGTAVKAGKYISKDVYVEVKKDISGEGGSILVEKELTPTISIENEIGVAQEGGITIRWEWDY